MTRAAHRCKYRAHPFLFHSGKRFASKDLFADELRKSEDFEWFYEDFVCFQKDSGHRALHVRVATHDQRKSIWLGVAHRSDDRETISGVRHVQISDEYVEALDCDQSQRFCHAGGSDHIKALAAKRFRHYGTNGIIVVHKQGSIGRGAIGRGHMASRRD